MRVIKILATSGKFRDDAKKREVPYHHKYFVEKVSGNLPS